MRRTNGTKIITDAVSEFDGVDPDAIGVEVSWSFGDGDADSVRMSRTSVIDAFAAHGFRCSVARELGQDEAIRRASQVAKNRDWLVTRELARHNKDVTRVLGVYVRRDPNAGVEVGDGWEMVARVRYSDAHGQFVHLPPEGQTHFMGDGHAGAAVAEACRLAQFANLVTDTAVNGDVSEALVDACRQAQCISRRPGGGGVYLVLAGERCGRFVRLLRQLARDTETSPLDRNAWRRQFCYQAQEVYAKPLTTASWAQSAEQQITSAVDRMLADLEGLVASGAMRAGTMGKRAAEADELMDLVGRCGAFLADKVPQLQHQLARVSASFKGALTDDLARAKSLLADFPDPQRSAKAAKAAEERAATLKGRPKKAQPATQPAPAERSLDELLDVGGAQ